MRGSPGQAPAQREGVVISQGNFQLNADGRAASGQGSQGDKCADRRTLNALELPALLEKIASLTQSVPGRVLVRRLRPSSDPATVRRRLRRLGQVRTLLEEGSGPGLGGLEEVAPLLSRLGVEEAVLGCEELLCMADFLGAVSRAASFLDLGGREMDEVFRLRNRITPLPGEAKRIRQVVGPGGSVSSGASAELGRLRKDLNHGREALRAKLGDMAAQPKLGNAMSDQVVTQRRDRFVLPLKANYKGALAGIIHDTSASGATCFVEPLEAVEDNNRLALLRSREQEEQRRILREVSGRLAANLQALHENLDALAKLDCLVAQAGFCQRLDCVEPELSSGGRVELYGARHPLMAWQQRAVPIKVKFGPERKVLIISGANAGGKTATIKTVGLLCLMIMCGLQAPVNQGSRIALFKQVFCELGDDQDLDRELSTFTAHAGRLALISQEAGPDSLVLVDELGGGTDPGEGAALGMAVTETLMQKGATLLCTTHFHRLKAFAALTQGVENVSVAFDQATGRPTYQLYYGTPGFSNALSVSKSLGFPPQLIARAEELLDQGERQTVELLRMAREDRDQAAAALAEVHSKLAEAENARQKARELVKAARKERAGALAEGKRRVRQVAGRLEERLGELVQQCESQVQEGADPKPGSLRQEIYHQRRQALEEVEEAVKRDSLDVPAPPKPAASPGRLKAGVRVLLKSLGQRGVLLEDPLPGQETVAVSLGKQGMRIMARPRDLEALPGGNKPPEPRPKVLVQASAGDGLDLKVVGLTVEEALPLVDKALDRAILAGRSQMRVVHGVGTGRLREAVRIFLSEHPYVISAGPDHKVRNGAGVTVAELRG